jgi:glucose dehydrogenase
MLTTPLLLAFGLGLLTPLTSRIGARGEGGTLAAVTLTVLAVIAVFAFFG